MFEVWIKSSNSLTESPVTSGNGDFDIAVIIELQWDPTNVIPYANVLGLRLDRSDADKPLWQVMVLTVITSDPIGNVAVALGTNEDQFTGRELIVPGMDAGETLTTLGTFLGKTAFPPAHPWSWNDMEHPQCT